MEELLQRYAEAKMRIAHATAEVEELKAEVLASVKANGGNVKNDFGVFRVDSKPRYTFSKAVKELQEEIDGKIDKLQAKVEVIKQEEIKTGKAKVTPVETLVFTIAKI